MHEWILGWLSLRGVIWFGSVLLGVGQSNRTSWEIATRHAIHQDNFVSNTLTVGWLFFHKTTEYVLIVFEVGTARAVHGVSYLCPRKVAHTRLLWNRLVPQSIYIYIHKQMAALY